jgi:hypothetical protein
MCAYLQRPRAPPEPLAGGAWAPDPPPLPSPTSSAGGGCETRRGEGFLDSWRCPGRAHRSAATAAAQAPQLHRYGQSGFTRTRARAHARTHARTCARTHTLAVGSCVRQERNDTEDPQKGSRQRRQRQGGNMRFRRVSQQLHLLLFTLLLTRGIRRPRKLRLRPHASCYKQRPPRKLPPPHHLKRRCTRPSGMRSTARMLDLVRGKRRGILFGTR